MSKLARVLALGVILAAMNLAGTTAVAQEQTTADAALQRVLAQEHGHNRGERASQEQTTADATLQRVLANEHGHNFEGTPAGATSPVRPAEPGGQPGLLVVALGVLAAALALVGALAAMTARRAIRGVRPRQAG
jgi:hypothetical protein